MEQVAQAQQTQQTSEDTKTIVTVLLLIFFFPVGLVLMWLWPAWSKKVKVIITAVGVGLPVLMGVIMIFFFMTIFYTMSKLPNPSNAGEIERKIERMDSETQKSTLACYDACESSDSESNPVKVLFCVTSCTKQIENKLK